MTDVRAPYLGQLKLGSTGEYVVLVKRALTKAGVYTGKTTGRTAGYAGPFFVRAVNKLAVATELPNVHDGVTKPGHRRVKAVTPSSTYGPRLHVKLAPYFDDYGAARLTAIARGRKVALVIAAGVNAMNLIIRNRALIWYSQTYRGSGIRYKRLPPRFGGQEDCSSERAWVCWVMDQMARRFGWRVPNPTWSTGEYDVVGNTTSERENPNVKHITWAQGKPGLAGVQYDGPEHVGSKLNARDVEEMGSNPGPLAQNWAYRHPVEVLSAVILDEKGVRAA